MLKVGLTGGIGSGKSTVARIFQALGIPVYNADAASKLLYQHNPEIRQAITTHFGQHIYENNVFKKERLAAAVFGDARQLHLLNSIIHPATIQHAKDWMAVQRAPYLVKEAALIFESGSGADLDYVIGVWAPLELRIKRVMARDGLQREAVLQRMQHQIEESVKMKLCDFVITNNDEELVLPQVLELHQCLLRLTVGEKMPVADNVS